MKSSWVYFEEVVNRVELLGFVAGLIDVRRDGAVRWLRVADFR